jgi:hypothetical protein
VESATLEVARSRTRGSGWAPQWAGLSSRECRAAQSRQGRSNITHARCEEAVVQEPSWGTAKRGQEEPRGAKRGLVSPLQYLNGFAPLGVHLAQLPASRWHQLSASNGSPGWVQGWSQGQG